MRVRAKISTWMFAALAGCALAPNLDEPWLHGYENEGGLAPATDGNVQTSEQTQSADGGSAVTADASELGAIGGADASPHPLVEGGMDTGTASGDGSLPEAPSASDGAALDAPAPSTDTGLAGSGGASTDAQTPGDDPDAAAAGPICSPANCPNRCAALPRCCNSDNECACQNLATRRCSLPLLLL